MEDIILDFWRCSLKNDFSEFDWDDAFDTYSCYLKTNCDKHGQGTLEDYKEYMFNVYGEDDLAEQISDIGGLTTYEGNAWWSFSGYDALDAVLKAQYERCRASFKGNVHGDNADLLSRIENRPRNLSTPKLIALFDEAIHAEHCNGNIIDDCDIDDLRAEAEAEYEEEKERQAQFPTEIRNFL